MAMTPGLARFLSVVTLVSGSTAAHAEPSLRTVVFFDGKKVIDAHDGTFSSAGKFGLWTKADSVIYFDDLTATPR
jgi:hypothetical protein